MVAYTIKIKVMQTITSPMLAGKCKDINQLHFPLLASPKLDGIRCLLVNGKALSRKFLPIPNNHIRTTLEREFAGYRGEFDGEIMIAGRTFNELSGDVRRIEGKPDFRYCVFDHVAPTTDQNVVNGALTPSGAGGLSEPYKDRMKMLALLSLPDFCIKLLPQEFGELDALQAYEQECIESGFEGIMVRSPDGPYKCGRSSWNEGYLLKIKRFEDDEATIVGYEEEMQNNNVAEQDAFGRTKRSSCQENLVGKNTLGKLICRNVKTGIEFGVGSGYTQKQRQELWQERERLKGKIIKYKFQPHGTDKAPRFPTFLGFRAEFDMST